MEALGVHCSAGGHASSSAAAKRPQDSDGTARKAARAAGGIKLATDTVREDQGRANRRKAIEASKAKQASQASPDFHGNDSFENSIGPDRGDATPTKPAPRPLGMRAGGTIPTRATTAKMIPGKTPAVKPAQADAFYHKGSSSATRKARTPENDSDEENRTPKALGRRRSVTSPSSRLAPWEEPRSTEQNRRTTLLQGMKFKKKGEAVSSEAVVTPQRLRNNAALAFFNETKYGPTPEEMDEVDEAKRKLKLKQAEEQRKEEEERQAIAQKHKEMSKATGGGHAFFAAVDSQPTIDSPAERLRREKIAAALDDEEEAIFKAYIHKSEKCPYCNEPMPAISSQDLKGMGTALQEDALASGKQPDWSQTISFCRQHRAETRTIPLGHRAGFPVQIAFEVLDERLEKGFVRARLRRFVRKPSSSKFFLLAEHVIATHGLAKWMEGNSQSNFAERVTTGYYGDLGRAIIIQHFQQLVNWGHLPSLTNQQVAPFTVPDFIISVLAPEAAILLIMEDQGWTSEACHGPEWKAARKAANLTRTASSEYGQCKFRATGLVGSRLLSELEKDVENKRARLEDERSVQEAAIQEKIRLEKDNREPIFVSSSAYSASELSTSGDDELAPVKRREPSPDRTPTVSRHKRPSQLEKRSSPPSRLSSQASQASSQGKRRSGKRSSPIPVSPEAKKSSQVKKSLKTKRQPQRHASESSVPQSSQEYGSWDNDFTLQASAAADKAVSSSRR
ncbi:hypothetical protein Q8F55_003508 [Vanrija albida]|uniref:Restriction of telomere capping protein 4 n=1 Tax=Vanrija albida TaxID=181172 RepID=A0ABR3Q458_9TREE